MTASAHAALDALQIAFDSADNQLEQLSFRLQSKLGAEGTNNPYAVVNSVHQLQSQIPLLRQHFLDVHHQKQQLVDLCKNHLVKCRVFASKLAPVLNTTVPPSQETTQLLAQFDCIAAELKPFNPTTLPQNQKCLENVPVASPKHSQSSKPVPNQPPMGNSKSSQASPTVKRAPAHPSASIADGFLPISKATYNRLPRNIKIRAGKLQQVNLFYEKVYSVLQQDSPLTDKQLMKATGEKAMDKFQTLRGLAVLTSSKNGWQLTSSKT